MADSHSDRFPCFGGMCTVDVEGEGPRGTPEEAVAWGRAQALTWQSQFSRLDPASELEQLNADPSERVGARPLIVELAAAIVLAGESTQGVVDGTVAADGSPAGRWNEVAVDRAAGTITRPPGLLLDAADLAKALLADVLGGWLAEHEDILVNFGGIIAIGGVEPAPRNIAIPHPQTGDESHSLTWARGGIANFRLPDEAEPTGVIAVTAVGPSALEADVLARWAVLSGLEQASACLTHGGLIFHSSGEVTSVPTPAPTW